MQAAWDAIAVMLPVAAALLLGLFSKKKGIVDERGLEGIKRLVMNFCLPAVLFGAFYAAEIDGRFFIIAATLFVACILGLLAGRLLVRLFPRLGGLFPFITAGFEAGMMGYGLYTMLFGAENLPYFAMVDLGQVLFVFTVYMALLNKRKGKSTVDTVREMVTSPVFLAIALGLVFALSGLGGRLKESAAGPAVGALLSYISAPTGMLMIFVVGSGLRLERESALRAFLSVALRTALMAGLCALSLAVLRMLIPLSASLYWAVILMFSLPAPFVLPVFSQAGSQDAYLSGALSIGAVFSLAAFAIISVLV